MVGGAPPRAIRPSDSDAVVPHMAEEGSVSDSSAQIVPDVKLKQEVVESAKYATSMARRAKNQLQQSIKAPQKSTIAPGMWGIKEIKEQQKKYNLIIPKGHVCNGCKGNLHGRVSERGRTSLAGECCGGIAGSQ